MKFSVDVSSRSTWVPLVLRLGLACIFIYSGLQKITGSGTGWGSSWIPDAADFIKPLPAAVQLMVAWGELAGGLALALGLLTRLAALGIAGIMGGTIYWLTGAQGFKSGWDYNFAVIVMCLALMISGGGTLAVDQLIRIKRRIFPGSP
jgi:putative oxidoreductase